jgi:hypothetical protein
LFVNSSLSHLLLLSCQVCLINICYGFVSLTLIFCIIYITHSDLWVAASLTPSRGRVISIEQGLSEDLKGESRKTRRKDAFPSTRSIT